MPRFRRFNISGAISPRAVKDFIARDRRDLSRWKRISDRELARRERALPIPIPCWNDLQHHQKVCAVVGARYRKVMFINDTGTGKTFLTLVLMAYFIKLGECKHFIVLVPNTSNKGEWGKQIKKHLPWLRFTILEDSTVNRWKQVEDNTDSDVFIDTYGGFIRMATDLKTVTRRGKAADELVLNKTKVKKLAKFFDGMAADESTALGNSEVLAFRILRQIMKQAGAGFELAAKPFNRDPIMMWSQAFLLDGGYALGETQGLFRSAFYTAKQNFWGGIEYTLKKEGQREISRCLDDISISYPANEADLPEVVPMPVELEMATDADSYIAQCRAVLDTAKGNYQEMKNAFLRLRQISSGFIGYKNEDTGDRASFTFVENPKLMWLDDFASKMMRGERAKTIVFHEFNYSAKIIEAMLKKRKVPFVMINGMQSEKVNDRNKEMYQDGDPKAEWLILSNQSGGYGLNLQMTKHGIFYESPVSSILRYQTERRFIRQFSDHDVVFLWDLLVRGTADHAIRDFHKGSKSLWKTVINDK